MDGLTGFVAGLVTGWSGFWFPDLRTKRSQKEQEFCSLYDNATVRLVIQLESIWSLNKVKEVKQ